MKLLAIRGRNLNSLADGFEIDFAQGPLAASGLFAVTGPTGAGKSTLLDALCLALYGALPRLENAPKGAAGVEAETSASDPRNALRQGAAEAFAEVDFLGRPEAEAGGGAGRKRYRARWEVRRARGKPDGALQSQKMRLVDLETGTPIADKLGETREAIADRIGLTFEQFKRSALLAQGEFEAFLAADASERAALLERITGGEIFSIISRQAHRRASEERKAIEALQAAAGAHQPLEAEQRAEAERLATEAADAAKSAQTGLETLREVDRFLTQERALSGELEAAEAARLQARTDLAEIAVAARGNLAQAARQNAEARAAIEQEEAERPWGARLADRMEEVDQSIDAVERLSATLKKLNSDRAIMETRRKDMAAALDSLSAQAKRAAEQSEASKIKADEARRAVETLDPAATEAAAEAARAGAEALAELAPPLERWRQAELRRATEASRRGVAETADAEAATALANTEQALPGVNAAYAEATEKLSRWREALGATAEDLRAGLRSGEPCPVCGSRDHAVEALTEAARAGASAEEQRLQKVATERDALLAAAAAAKADQEAAARARRDAAAALEAAGEALETARRQATRALVGWPEIAKALRRPDLAKAAQDIAAGLGKETSEAIDNAAETLRLGVREHSETAKAALAKLSAARKDAEAAEAASRSAVDAVAAIGRRIEEARAEREKLATALDENLAAIRDAQEAGAGSAAVLSQLLAGLRDDWRDHPLQDTRALAAAEAEAARDRRGAAQRLIEQAPRIAADRESLEALLKSRTSADPEFSQLLADADSRPDPSIGHGQALAAAEALTRDQTRAETAAAAHRKHIAAPPKAAAPYLRAKAPDEEPDEEPALQAALTEAEQHLAETAKRLEAANLTLHEDDAVRARLGAAARALEARRAEAEKWLQLDALIGAADGAKFRKFAQSLTLQTLAGLATQRLRELAPRYALEAAPGDPTNPDLSLIAVDRDMGDARRPVRQLSGGERFLTSLALALALADLSSERGVVVDSLFIDEGFGALDGDSLGMALSALEALQATGRQVGVVTHVEALSERIACRVVVEPQGGGRSKVRVIAP